jgi:hypothetical protein
VALVALGEDPDDFQRRFESLIATYQPADALEMGLVFRMVRDLWRAERFDHMAESVSVKHLEQSQGSKALVMGHQCLQLDQQMKHVDALAYAVSGLKAVVSAPELKLFENCREGLSAEKAKEILVLLVRLREPGTDLELGPLAELLSEDVPAAEGEEREPVRAKLVRSLEAESGSLMERILAPDENPDAALAQFDRDQMLVAGQTHASVLRQAEELSLRQLWRTTNLLLKIKARALKLKKHQK